MLVHAYVASNTALPRRHKFISLKWQNFLSSIFHITYIFENREMNTNSILFNSTKFYYTIFYASNGWLMFSRSLLPLQNHLFGKIGYMVGWCSMSFITNKCNDICECQINLQPANLYCLSKVFAISGIVPFYYMYYVML